ncbi:hypothetical protein SSTU70S_03048 [Stutzerimonas stutzeri]
MILHSGGRPKWLAGLRKQVDARLCWHAPSATSLAPTRLFRALLRLKWAGIPNPNSCRFCAGYSAGFIEYEPEQSYVWVHIWWDHNSPRMALGPTLRQKTFNQIRELPEQWRTLYTDDLIQRLPDNGELRELVSNAFGPSSAADEGSTDRVSIPYPYPIDRGRVNTNSNYNSNPTTPEPEPLGQLSTGEREQINVLLRNTPDQEARFLLAELSKAMARPGHITQSPIQYFHGLLQRHRSGDFVPTTQGAKTAATLARSQLKAMVVSGRR